MAVRKAERAARKGRAIQDKVRSTKSKGGKQSKEAKGAAQTATRAQPAPPQPRQHQDKPGQESRLKPKPRYSAPDYRGSGKLEGKVAIITGGDSGIGRAVAVLFAREGADVAIVYLAEHGDAAETKTAIEHEGREALLISGDVADAAFCRSAVKQVLDAFGQVDILVNNAAFQQHVTSFEDLTEEQWDHTFKTNIYGYFYMARAAVPHLGDGGVIINTGSVAAFDGSPGLLDYSATKGAGINRREDGKTGRSHSSRSSRQIFPSSRLPVFPPSRLPVFPPIRPPSPPAAA
ncbi:MAG TPA: SDR family NAD(P)-dependent oxidoreductase [Gemmatimonadales bacterium]|jgi:hypothetical protein|nr:SDR family NAD(P)-dependent oxidoreductase [Gemmatimonadales bacterium]